MFQFDRTKVADQLTAAAILIASVIPAWQASSRGFLELGFGPWSWLFWSLVVIWGACVFLVLRWRRRRWILLSAPTVLLPVAMCFILMIECLSGNCL